MNFMDSLGVIFIMFLCCCVIAAILDCLTTSSETPAEKLAKLQKQVAKEEKKAAAEAKIKQIKKESRICPRITTWLGDEYKRFFIVYCHEGIIYDNVNQWNRRGECAMASECPGAYHNTLPNKMETI